MGKINVKIQRTGLAKPARNELLAEVACCDEPSYSFRYGYNSDLLLPGNNVTIVVKGGCPNFTWSTNDANYTFADGVTSGRTNVLTAAAGAANSDVVKITIVDSCGTTLTAYVNNYAPRLPVPDAEPSFGILAIDDSIELTSQESGTTIYYDYGVNSVDDPDNNSYEYDGFIYIGMNRILKAINTKAGYRDSYVGAWYYAPIVSDPVIDPDSGSNPQTGDLITITCETSGVSIHYTTDGSLPDENSAIYSSPFALAVGVDTIIAKAYLSGYTPSNYVKAKYIQSWTKVASTLYDGGTEVSLYDLALFEGQLYAGGGPAPNLCRLYSWNAVNAWYQVLPCLNTNPIVKIMNGQSVLWATNAQVLSYNGSVVTWTDYGGNSVSGMTIDGVEASGVIYIITSYGNLYSFDVMAGSWTLRASRYTGESDATIAEQRYAKLVYVNGGLYRFQFGSSRLLYWTGTAWAQTAAPYSTNTIGMALMRSYYNGAIYGFVKDSVGSNECLVGLSGNTWIKIADLPEGAAPAYMANVGSIIYGLQENGTLYKYTPGNSTLEIVAMISGPSAINGFEYFNGYLYFLHAGTHELYRW